MWFVLSVLSCKYINLLSYIKAELLLSFFLLFFSLFSLDLHIIGSKIQESSLLYLGIRYHWGLYHKEGLYFSH